MPSVRLSARRFLAWFTQTESPIPLAWFRIALAAFCLANVYVVRSSILDIYGQYGFVQWLITATNLYPGLPHIGHLAFWLRTLGVSADQTVYLVLAIYVIALVGLLIGWLTRWMAVVAWFIHFLWMHAGGGLLYGMDIFTHIALFYIIFMPSGDYLSVDVALGRRRSHDSIAAGVTRKILQLHVCIIYVSSGLEKASGIQWWNGEAMWRAVTLPAFQQFEMGWLAELPWLAIASGWLVLTIEIGYGYFVWRRTTRWIWLLLAVGMHLSIGLFLGMWLFGWIMIILNLSAFGWEVLADWRILKRRSESSSTIGAAVGADANQ